MATVWEVDGLVAREDVINHLKKDCRPLKRSCAVGPVLEGEFSTGMGERAFYLGVEDVGSESWFC